MPAGHCVALFILWALWSTELVNYRNATVIVTPLYSDVHLYALWNEYINCFIQLLRQSLYVCVNLLIV